jgi:hypothetical protein
MFKNILKRFFVSLYPLSLLFQLFRKGEVPFLCIITPIFDPALPSLKKLIQELKSQSHKEFIHVCISGGESPKVKRYFESLSKNDPRFIYITIPFKQSKNWKDILINIGKRRTYVFKNYIAERYMFLDADSSMSDKNYIAKLAFLHRFIHKDILITQTSYSDGTVLPFFPINLGRIDITNYIFTRHIAEKHSYPINVDPKYGPANDFRFFKEINKGNNTIFFPIIGVKKNVRPAFKSILDLYNSSLK